ncbi:MAG: lipid-A-disaccharide synthase [Pseudomonadota bacterium]
MKKIYFVAGEDSGDFLGSQLMNALKTKQPDIEFYGVGGELMQGQGIQSLFPMKELSVMGVFEILPRVPHFIKRINQTVADIQSKKPDMVITIDAPDFSFRVQKKLRKLMGAEAPQLVHYVAPTVWAWRPKRAKKIATFLDHILCLFPFEPPYFEKEGLKAYAVGHPMVESGLLEAEPLCIQGSKKLGLFFGSRQGEIKRISPIICEALEGIIHEQPDIELIIPTLPHLKEQIEEILSPFDVSKHIQTETDQKWSVFKSCDAAIAVSGTVGLELAACNIPHLIAYRVNAFTGIIGRLLIKTPYAHLANIILNKPIVPEFIQENCRADLIVKEALSLLQDNTKRSFQIDEFEKVRLEITGPKGQSPSQVAADYLLSTGT